MPLSMGDCRLHELRPHFGRHALRLLCQLLLHIGERLHIFFEVRTHETLHGMAVETDDVGKNRLTEHRRPARFLFQNDLQQDAAGEVFTRFGIAHHHVLVVDHQLPHFGQGDVGGSVGVVQATVGYF